MPSLKYSAVRVEQPGGTFYVLSMPSEVLERISYVSARSRENPAGIQRFLSAKRVQEVTEFVNQPEALLANNIIVNLSAEAIFTPSDDGSNRGVLMIPDRIGEAMVIDGQHRLFGFRGSSTQLELNVSAFIDLELEKQAKLFRDINTEQKGIPPSLAYDLLDLTKDAHYADLRAHEIVKRLNEESDSPWFESIKMQGIGPGLITQSSFIEFLKPHLNPQTGSVGYLDAEHQYLAIKNFWAAVKALQTDAWGKKGFLLTKTLGFSALMGVFTRVVERALEKKDLRVGTLESLMKPVGEFDFSSTGLKGMAGSAGRIALRDRLLSLCDLHVRPKVESIKF